MFDESLELFKNWWSGVVMTYKLNLEKMRDKITNTINELVNHMQQSGSVIVATK